MKKLIISVAVIIAVVLYFVYQHGSGTSVQTDNNSPLPTPTPDLSTSPSPSASPTASGSPTPTSKPTSGLKDGSYTSIVTDAIYGPMQVKITVSGGKLTNIQFLQYPNSAGHTTEVSNMALPILKQEALQSQSANVQIVSGATQTTEGFQQAMADALAKAKI